MRFRIAGGLLAIPRKNRSNRCALPGLRGANHGGNA
jgi:hypothetical protein